MLKAFAQRIGLLLATVAKALNRVAMAEWLAHRTPNHKIVGSSPTKASWLTRNHPTWAMCDDNDVSVHSCH